MLSFTCQHCGQLLKVKEELAGKKGKCPKCGASITVPEDAAKTPETPARPAGAAPSNAAPDVADDITQPPDAMGPAGASAAAQAELTEFLAPPQQADELGRLGPYRILKILGRGGMGAVYQAEDPGLKRLVALKVMLPGMAASAASRQRFLREARAAAAIKHEHIITIHEVGEDRGIPYLAMEFLLGEPLDQRLKREPPLTLDEIIRIGWETAQGMAAAHDEGLVHRDIKPANIWLETRRESRVQRRELRVQSQEAEAGAALDSFRVKILDFGLARLTADQTNITQSGAIVGTPAYMAPEQARGVQVDQRCDLFSLGCVLYRLTTGQAAFKGNDTMAIVSSLALGKPTPPAKVNPQTPRPLSDLILHLLEKEPDQRPGSAAEVAEALAGMAAAGTALAHSGGLPRYARPGRGSFASGRGKWLAGGTAALGLVMLVLWLTGAFGVRHADKGTLLVESEEPTVKIAIRQGPKTLFEATAQRKFELPVGDYEIQIAAGPGGMMLSADRIVVAKDGQAVVRVYYGGEGDTLEDFYPGGPLQSQAWVAGPAPIRGLRAWTLETRGHRGNILTFAYSAKAGKLATGGRDGTIRLWEPRTGKLLNVLVAHEQILSGALGLSGVHHLAWSLDGKMLASVGCESHVRLWNAESGQIVRTWRTAGSAATFTDRLAFSPDGKTFARGLGKGRIGLWNVSSGKPPLELEGHEQSGVLAVAFSPDGATLATGALNATICLWDIPGNTLRTTLKSSGKSIASLAWSADGKSLASLDQTGQAALWDLHNQKELRSWKPLDKNTGFSLAWAHDGKTLGFTGTAGIVLCNIDSDKPLRVLPYKQFLSAWLPDLNVLAGNPTGEGTLNLLDVETGKALPGGVSGFKPDPAYRLLWSTDSKAIAMTGFATSKVWTWEIERGTFQGTSAAKMATGITIALGPDAKMLAVGGANPIQLWDLPANKELATLAEFKGKSGRVLFAPDGKLLASAHDDDTVRIWDVVARKLLHELPNQISLLAWSPDGKFLACLEALDKDDKKKVRIWNADTGTAHEATLPVNPAHLSWRPAHDTLAITFTTGLRFWNWEADNVNVVPEFASAFHPAWIGRSPNLALFHADTGHLHYVDPESGKKLRTLERAAPAKVTKLAFAPDGRQLAVALGLNGLRLVNVEAGKVRGTIVFLTDAATPLKGKGAGEPQYLFLSPDGHFRSSSAKLENELLYIAHSERGQEAIAPADFAKKYGWTNDPSKAAWGK